MIIPILEVVKSEEGSELGWCANGYPDDLNAFMRVGGSKVVLPTNKRLWLLVLFVRPAMVVEAFLMVFLLILLLFLVILCVVTVSGEMIVINAFVAKPLDSHS